MKELLNPLYRAEQVRELDRIAMEDFAIPGYTLMTRAGSASFELLLQLWPEAKNIVVMCGIGNNAGDGYVLARLAHENGLAVRVVQLGDVTRLKGDALKACTDMKGAGLDIMSYQAGMTPMFSDADVIVDAILGTGLERAVSGEWRQVIEECNAEVTPVLSIDIPSGLNSDTGMAMGVSIRALHTITFIGMKRGMVTGEGPDYCGEIHCNDLAVPVGVYQKAEPDVVSITDEYVASQLPQRRRSAHKGLYGHVLVIGGDHGMNGAVAMAGLAAARSGAGLVSVATRKIHAPMISAVHPELMCHGVEQASELESLLGKASVIAIGPGLGQSGWGMEMFARILDSDLPLVLDADALNLLAQEPVQRENWILTPHPGEAGRLLQCSAKEVQADRFAACRKIVERYSGVCVLKGVGTLVAAESTAGIKVCTSGNPGMASGGMGDVLTGVIAGLIAQGLDPEPAASCGVYIHATAADLASINGERGLMATDLLPEIQWQVNP